VFVFHVVVGLGGYVPEDSESFLVSVERLAVPFLFEEQIPLFFDFLAVMHLHHVVLLPEEVVLSRVVEANLEVLGESLIVLPLVLKLTFLELRCFREYFLELLH
jgi:hypothetical protein